EAIPVLIEKGVRMSLHRIRVLALFLVGVLCLAPWAAAQSGQTDAAPDSGTTADTVAKFDGSGNLIGSAIKEHGGNMAVGPLDYPLPDNFSGAIVSTGSVASVSFAKRTLTLWPVSPGAGDSFAWYNPDGTARLWTWGAGDLVTVTKDAVMTVGNPSL